MKRKKTRQRIDEYDRCTLEPMYERPLELDTSGADALTAFYQFDTHGKRVSCQQPDVVARWVGIKKAIHFHIKEWLAGYREGTFAAFEIEQCIDEFHLPTYAAKELRQAYKTHAADYFMSIGRIHPSPEVRLMVAQ